MGATKAHNAMLGPVNSAGKKGIITEIRLTLAMKIKPSTLHVSALGIAATAIFGAALDSHIARAVDASHPAMEQKLPSFSNLVEQVGGAVVSVHVTAEEESPAAGPGGSGERQANPFLNRPSERFFNAPDSPLKQAPGGLRIVTGQGSGFFISTDGYIVTNNHVANHAVSLEIVMYDGKVYPARAIGADSRTDLALLKVDGRNDFPHVKFAQSEVKVGEWVIAMGNPFGLGGTVTAGIVSARGRNIGQGPYDDFLQIDAPVNRGNSGGPAFNQDGEVAGVNTAIFSPSGGSVGIAFAIPSSTAELVVKDLREHGHVTRGWLGVQIQSLTPDLANSLSLKSEEGALIAEPDGGSPAEEAGLEAGDVIAVINGSPIKDARDLARKVAGIAPGTEVKLRIVRDGKEGEVSLTVGKLGDKPVRRARAVPQMRDRIEHLGLRIAPARQVIEDEDRGLAVIAVEPGGKAQELGLSPGDIIVKVGSAHVSREDELRKALNTAKTEGRSYATALVKRGANQRFIALPVASG
jgi:serine protease Do